MVIYQFVQPIALSILYEIQVHLLIICLSADIFVPLFVIAVICVEHITQ